MSSPFRTLWQKWKALPLPWRRRWLAGTDLANNKYYYFRPSGSTPKPRRILQQVNPHIPYSDIAIPVQWHQWLRHTRASAPTIQELRDDEERKERLKVLAAAADRRWAGKPSVLDRPRRGNLEVGVGDGEGVAGVVGRRGESVEGVEGGGRRLGEGVKGEDVRDIWGEGGEGRGEGEKGRGEGGKGREESPWVKARARGAGEGYQPESWRPPGSGG